MNSQTLKELKPKVVDLDFSAETINEWKKRDQILKDIEDGIKDWEYLNETDSKLLDKYPETFGSIWDILGDGDNWYDFGGPYSVTASSYLQSQGANTYKAINAHDHNYKNAWVEGVKGYGVGEYLIYTFKAESPRVTEVIIVNGYVKSKSAYKNNSRVKKMKMYVKGKPYAILCLEDRISEQIFRFDPLGYNDRSNLENLKNKPDWTLKFEILEVYKGLKYDDTVISELYFQGMDVY